MKNLKKYLLLLIVPLLLTGCFGGDDSPENSSKSVAVTIGDIKDDCNYVNNFNYLIRAMPSYSGTACIKDKAGNVYVARKYESGEVIKNLRIPVARIIAMELDDIDSECNYVNSFNNLIKAMSNYSGTACIRNEAGKVYAAREYKDGKIKKTFSDIVTREQLKK